MPRNDRTRLPVDILIGARVRQCREARTLEAEALALSLNISTSRLEDFESGVLRLSASNLFEMANALDVPVHYFLQPLTNSAGSSKIDSATGLK